MAVLDAGLAGVEVAAGLAVIAVPEAGLDAVVEEALFAALALFLDFVVLVDEEEDEVAGVVCATARFAPRTKQSAREYMDFMEGMFLS
ncbi:MAG TPA: hypothetical protein VK716_02635 [Terracidiphilus sp.]|nr:hypothetical protein [Terracidiphilus sp.]